MPHCEIALLRFPMTILLTNHVVVLGPNCAPCRRCSPSLDVYDDIILSSLVSYLSFPFFLWPFLSLPTLYTDLGEPSNLMF